jgi:hypothetical protein
VHVDQPVGGGYERPHVRAPHALERSGRLCEGGGHGAGCYANGDGVPSIYLDLSVRVTATA